MATKKQKQSSAEVQALRQIPEVHGRILIGLPTVKTKCDVQDDETIYNWIRTRGFPRPLSISRKCSRWYLDEVDNYLANLPRGASGKNPVQKKAA